MSSSPSAIAVTEISVPTTNNNNHLTTQHDGGGDDIVEINVGGKLKLQVLRSTLCLPPADTKFSRMFSSKTTSTTKPIKSSSYVQVLKDNDGRIFLDHDPELIEIIINFLRQKKNEDPFDPIIDSPECPAHKTKDFRRLLHYFDLTAYFHYPTTASPFIASETLRRMSIDDIVLDQDENGGNGGIVSRDASVTTNSIVGDNVEGGGVGGEEIIGTNTPQGYHFCYG
jgi:hypothetical protein